MNIHMYNTHTHTYIYIYIYIYIWTDWYIGWWICIYILVFYNNAWTNICKRRDIPNKCKNNFITRNNKLSIETHKSDTTHQNKPIISCFEGPFNKISWLLEYMLKLLRPKISDEVIHWQTQLNTEQLKQNNYAFSLGVIYIYSTVPAYPAIDIRTYYLLELILSQTNSNRHTPTIIHLGRQWVLHLQWKYL